MLIIYIYVYFPFVFVNVLLFPRAARILIVLSDSCLTSSCLLNLKNDCWIIWWSCSNGLNIEEILNSKARKMDDLSSEHLVRKGRGNTSGSRLSHLYTTEHFIVQDIFIAIFFWAENDSIFIGLFTTVFIASLLKT